MDYSLNEDIQQELEDKFSETGDLEDAFGEFAYKILLVIATYPGGKNMIRQAADVALKDYE